VKKDWEFARGGAEVARVRPHANIHLTLSAATTIVHARLIDRHSPYAGLDLTVIPRRRRSVTPASSPISNSTFVSWQIAPVSGLKSRGARITAIPVFPHRRFNHSCVMVRLDSTSHAEDLRGPPHRRPCAFQCHRALDRGVLQHEFGVAPKLDPLDRGWRRACAGWSPPPWLRIERRAGWSKDAKFTGDGRVGCSKFCRIVGADASATTSRTAAMAQLSRGRGGLLSPHRNFPYSPRVVVKDEVLQRDPEVAAHLVRVFGRCQQRAYHYWGDTPVGICLVRP